MALKKSFDTQYGISADYWYVCNLATNWFAQEAQITLAGYPTKESADTGKNPISFKSFTINGEQFVQLFNLNSLDKEGVNPVSAVYNYIKLLDEWVGVEDVIYDPIIPSGVSGYSGSSGYSGISGISGISGQ